MSFPSCQANAACAARFSVDKPETGNDDSDTLAAQNRAAGKYDPHQTDHRTQGEGVSNPVLHRISPYSPVMFAKCSPAVNRFYA